jgi:hypothetical protein
MTKIKEGQDQYKPTEYRSILGKLIYYMTKIAPEIANTVCELATHIAYDDAE